jgi:putative peptidoglycan lipid II flippase
MNFNRIFNSQTKTITFAALLLGLSSAISGFLGLVRDGLLAGHFGVWKETNSYFAAFRINDFFYNLFVIGGLVVAFLPLFSDYYSKEKEKAWEMVNYVLNFFLISLILASFFIFIFSPFLVKLITPGFSAQERSLTVNLIRIMILSPIFFGLSAILAGILQYFNRFLIYSLAPILYNLGIISGIVFLSPHFGILGVGIGLSLGAACHWLIQLPAAINCGFKYRFHFNLKYPAIKRIFYLALPRLFAIAAQQINLLFITAIASMISGGISIFSFANNLQNFPIGIVAIPFAIAAFPALSRNWAQGQKRDFLENFSSAFRQILFLIIPISLLTFILRAQIVRLILGTLGEQGKFDWVATSLTTASLGVFSIGILASALIPLISRAFFSFQDTKTPTLIALFAVISNIILSFTLVWVLKFPNFFQSFIREILKIKGIENISVVGLPLAFSLAAIIQFILLLIFLQKRIGDFKFRDIYFAFLKIFTFSIISGLLTYLTIHFLDYYGFINTHTVFGLSIQTISAGLFGLFAYFGFSFFSKSPELFNIIGSFKKQFRKEVIPIKEIEIVEP